MGRKTKSKNKKYKSNTTSETKRERKKKNRENLRKIAAQNFAKFCEQVDKLGLRIKEVQGDGNCLFRAVSDQLEGNENNHNFYRQSALDYMIANQDHFKFFIEDDENFDQYVARMSKDGKWGGNLEIYAMSMKFTVNFYIHIYNHPMYIVRNWDHPIKNIQLSYHEGEHYNSIRLKDDFEENVPKDVPLELINCCESTSDAKILMNSDDEENNDNSEKECQTVEEGENENENVIITSNGLPKEEKSEVSENGEIIFKGTIIKDLSEKPRKYQRCVMTEEGIIMDELGDFKKCHCESNKKYKNCCINSDIKGEYDKQNLTFFCDLTIFKSRFTVPSKEKENETSSSAGKSSNEVSSLTKRVEKIFI